MHWQPTASIAALRLRAKIIAEIRDFFTTRGYLEVETPCLGKYGSTDVYLSCIAAQCQGSKYYLQTSPEYHMKRLLAAGSGPIFQLARVFRDDELGRWHNPEFTLLEWYQLDVDHHQLLDEINLLLMQLLQCPPLYKITYAQAFMASCGIDPMSADVKELQSTLRAFDLADVITGEDKDPYLFLLMSHVVEPFFKHDPMPIAIVDFPPSQASLAQIKNGVALRFEVYMRGVELANGFYELTNPRLQSARFQQDNTQRLFYQLPTMDADLRLLAALSHGLPQCSGVALGVERMLALIAGKDSIKDSFSFDFTRC